MFSWFKRKPKQAPAPETAPVQPPEPAAPRPSYNGMNRVEEVRFSFSANYQQAIKYREALGILDPRLARSPIPVQEGDRIDFGWTIVISYFGQVARCLGIITEIAEDPEMLVKVEISELQHGRCLLLETLRAVDDAIERIQDANDQKMDPLPC